MKKVYCKNCKFKTIYTLTYCEPYIRINSRRDDYHGPRHFIRKLSLGTFEREKKNKNNDCNRYKRKWWKFWVWGGENGN